ncbi:DUF3995 domain-containing protein [Paenibacillus sp. KN14-4R]|uniref:DUF3995 domain-containing protein n=1 Tax=Paenibacillus sp. KN14-4R TaxID=3445773 RepID=UPI003FA0076E
MSIVYVISALLLIGIGGLHVYWAFGGRWGASAVIPTTKDQKPTFVPGRIATIVVALLLFASSALLLIKAGLLTVLPISSTVTWGCGICAAVFGLRAIGDFRYVGLMKKVRGTRFAIYDYYLFTPLCMWLCLTFIAVNSHLGST